MHCFYIHLKIAINIFIILKNNFGEIFLFIKAKTLKIEESVWESYKSYICLIF